MLASLRICFPTIVFAWLGTSARAASLYSDPRPPNQMMAVNFNGLTTDVRVRKHCLSLLAFRRGGSIFR